MSSGSHRPPQVAVIGGGVAGAVCGHLLAKRGAHVDVFDMGRQQPGGRVSSRTARSSSTTISTGSGGNSAGGGSADSAGGGGSELLFQFDYGCQFFQATSPAMKALVAEWLAAGVVAEWRPRLGVYDVARGAVRLRDELTPSEATQVAASGLPPLPSPSSGPLYAGTPSMAVLVAHLLGAAGQPESQQQPQGAAREKVSGAVGEDGIQLRLDTRVQSARWSEGRWQLSWQRSQRGGGGGGASCGPLSTGMYDALVFTDSQVARPGAPGHVAFEGSSPALEELTTRLRSLTRVPQFALMMGWGPTAGAAGAAGGAADVSVAAVAAPPRLPCDALHVLGGSAVQWVANDSSKPGRDQSDGGQCWVAITRPDFAARILHDQDTAAVPASASASAPSASPAGPEYRRARKAAQIWEELQRDLRGVPGLTSLPPPAFLTAHRWSSCYAADPLGLPVVAEAAGRWAACGDFCTGPGLERAAASGAAAAEAVAEMLQLPGPSSTSAAAKSAASDWHGAY